VDADGASSDGKADTKPDATDDAQPAPSDASDAPRDTSSDACDVGCSRAPSGGYCQTGEALWVCGTASYSAAFATSCRDLATGIQRYCCPTSFLSQCQ
jgi:hypothetical protein